jgi:hypothetical protein
MPSPGQQPKSLEIRVRQTLFGDGATASRATVFCPGQGRSLDLTDCLICREFVEMSLDLGEQDGVLKCHPSRAPILRSSRSKPASGTSAFLHFRSPLPYSVFTATTRPASLAMAQ